MFKTALSALSAIVSTGVQKPAQILALSLVAAGATIPNFTEHIGKAIKQVGSLAGDTVQTVEKVIDLSDTSFRAGANIVHTASARTGRLAVMATGQTENVDRDDLKALDTPQ